MPAASLHLLRMADLQYLAIPGQNKVPRNGLRFSRFEHTSPAMLWEWEAFQPENWLLRTGRVLVEGQEMLLCVVDADCESAVAMCEELLPPTSWTVDTRHGRHYYYLTTEINSQQIMGGLDRKCGRNVYLVAPGTPEYVQSPDWGHGWPPTLSMRQWMVLGQTWLDQRPEPESHTGSGRSIGRDKKRRRHHNQAGSSNWRSKVQQCEIHPICEGRRNSYLRRVAMSRLFNWRRKDGYFANRARMWNYMVTVNENRFEDHRLSLTEVSQIVTKAMRDARQQYSEEGFHQSQARKCRRSSVVRSITAQQRSAEVRTARMAGVAVKEVARAFRLSCRQVSRIAPLRGPRSLCGEALSVDPRGAKGMANVTFHRQQQPREIAGPAGPHIHNRRCAMPPKRTRKNNPTTARRLRAKANPDEYRREGLVTVDHDSFSAMLFAPEKFHRIQDSTPGILMQNRFDVVQEKYIVQVRRIDQTWEYTVEVDGKEFKIPGKTKGYEEILQRLENATHSPGCGCRPCLVVRACRGEIEVARAMLSMSDAGEGEEDIPIAERPKQPHTLLGTPGSNNGSERHRRT